MPATKHTPHPDPLIEAQIQRSLKRYEGRVPAHMLDTMREILEDALTTNPIAVGLLNGIRAGHAAQGSGVVGRPGEEGGELPIPTSSAATAVEDAEAAPPVVDHSGETRRDGAEDDPARKSGEGPEER